MKHLRLILIIAGAAFLLAMLTGIFNGIAFGTVLFRSFLSGVLFAALAFGLTFAIDRFLPELSGSEQQTEKPDRDLDDLLDSEDDEMDIPGPVQAGNVDILLDEENPHESAAPGPGTSDGPVTEEETQALTVEDLEDDADSAMQEPQTDFVEEVDSDDEEPLPDGIQADGGSDDSIGEVEDIGEDLPSLDQFSSTFNSVDSNFLDSDNSGSKPVSSGGSDSVELMGSEHSTNELAKAVQTLLSKDEKG